jgi:hypothetical protein
VINPTIPTSNGKALLDPLSLLRKLAELIGAWLFSADDSRAAGHGWQVLTGTGGLSRRYRDPRFGSLRECGRCAGRGTLAGRPCTACAGTGRITLHQRDTGPGDAG